MLWGLAHGLEPAVANFNRLPALGIAIARRVTSSACAAYFDDELSLEFVRHANVSELGLCAAFTLISAAT